MKRLAATILAAAGLLLAGPARAATDGGNVNVSATVADACLIGDATLSFGLYEPLTTHAAAPLDASAPIVISCTGGTPWQVGLSDGANFAGTRQMRSGASFLSYELYQGAPGGARWGDAVLVERASGTQPVTGTTTLTVHGRIPGGQLAAAGAYTDTVVATIYF